MAAKKIETIITIANPSIKYFKDSSIAINMRFKPNKLIYIDYNYPVVSLQGMIVILII
jgi:hypothetical protein